MGTDLHCLFFEYQRDFKEIGGSSMFKTPAADLKKRLLSGPTSAIPELIVLFVSIDNLTDTQFWNALGKSKFRQSQSNGRYLPMLTIGAEDLMNSAWQQTKASLKEIDRRFRFLDSSIWQHYEVYKKGYETSLNSTLTTIEKNTKNGRYLTIVAQEFIEFQTRLLSNSMLNVKGGHASAVTPFPFHSEKQMRTRYEAELATLKRKAAMLNTLRWKVLLVDDKSSIPLTLLDEADKTLYDSGQLHKSVIISELIGQYVSIESANSVSAAMEMLQQSCYDVILLDYYITLGETYEFGTRLLDELFAAKLTAEKKLLGHHWIFSISSYYTAFLDAIQYEGKSLISNDWFISRGADPLNTPSLFLEQLIQFVSEQLKVIGIFKTQGEEEVIYDFRRIGDLWQSCLKSLKGQGFSRGWASNSLTKILNYWDNIQSLNDSQRGGSLFARTFKESDFYHEKYLSEYRSGLYGYLTNLLFMLSYSDGHQWEEMKTCLEIVKAKLPEDTSIQGVYKLLNDRIIQLKKKYDS